MPLSALLRVGSSPAERSLFNFEHAMAHRTQYGSLSPLAQFSVLPYNLDPTKFNGRWDLLTHQQAHWDAGRTLTTFPWFWFDRFAAPPDPIPTGGLGTRMNGNMIDTNLSNPGNLSWWVHENHTQHLNAMDLLAKEATFPFW